MGREKAAMMEADERGWTEPDGYVCPDCVEDEFLKDVIRENACQPECDYCGNETEENSAAPVAELMEHISSAVFCWYNNPSNTVDLFWDNEEDNYFGGDSMNTTDMLESLPLDCHEQLFNDIAEAFIDDEWVETASGCRMGSHPYELKTYSWERFAHIVKHEARYFFQHSPSNLTDEEQYYLSQQEHYNPANFLPSLEKQIKNQKLFCSLPEGIALFRARPKKEEEDFILDPKQLSAPPPKLAGAGRMNPAGISYFYLAFEQETALAEVQATSYQQTAIGQFETQRELHLLDLTNPLPKLSIFDKVHRDDLDELFFLDNFIKEITKPVSKDGSEHVDYVPSQVVSEYFALVFRLDNGKPLDGIKYPSVARSGSYNLVLFPTERDIEPLFNQVEFKNGWNLS